MESSDAGVEMKKARFVEFLKEEEQDMTKIKEGRENSLSFPSSMRLLLYRVLSSLTPRRGFALSLTFSSKRKRNAADKVELVRNGRKTVVDSFNQVPTENEESSEFAFAGVNHGQRMLGECKCELFTRDCVKEGKLKSRSPSDSNDRVKYLYSSLSREAGNGHEVNYKDSQDNVAICSTSAGRAVSSGRYLDEASFHLGIGVGLAFLIANSKNEFDKLKELRTEMEILLKDIKCQLQRKDMIMSGTKLSNNNLEYFGSNSNGAECTENHLSNQNNGTPDCFVLELSTMKCDHFSKTGSTEGSTKSVGMGQLEAELEAELERLQLKLDAEHMSELPGQQYVEIFVKNTDTARNISPSFELECEVQESQSRERNGISPHELENRLHELLETRQQEQIAELESALEFTKSKLHEKEMEICWWKDNVQFFLHHKG